MDETGFLMAPLVGTTQAWRGHTPILQEQGAHRQKASAAAALCVSPLRRHVRLFWQVFPDSYVDAQAYPEFLEDLLAEVAGSLVLVQDQAPLHRGAWMEQFLLEQGRAWVEPLPAYAPELNPVEFLWNYLKAQELVNFAPLDLDKLVHTLCAKLLEVSHDQHRLRSFLYSSGLDW